MFQFLVCPGALLQSCSRPTVGCAWWGSSESPGADGCFGSLSQTDTDLAWDRASHGLEDPALPKKQVCTPRMERKLGRNRAREQPLPQRSDGEEEEEEVEAALSPALDSSVEAREFCLSGARAEPEEREDPCIINTGDVSLSELVKSMHPYCLPTFTVCLDPETEPVAKELLSGPVLLEIVPGEGESMEIPVVLQPLAPSFPDLEQQLVGTEEAPRESIPEDREEFPGTPDQENRMEEEKKEEPPGKEPSCTTPESTSPPETAAPGTRSPDSSSRHSMEAPLGTKHKGSEKGRGRERARKSRKKKAEDQSEQARPGQDCVAPHLHPASSGQPAGQPPASRRRAARPSVQVSDFLARQLEQVRKERQMDLRAEPAPRLRGRPLSTAGASLPEKVQKETVPEVVTVALEKAETVVPLEKTAPSVEEQPAAVCPGPADHGEGDAQPTAGQGGGLSEAASPLPERAVGPEPPQNLPAAESSEVLPKEAKPKALSLREYRIRMLHRQPSPGGRKDGEKQAASKWPSVPEPPTELAEIPCLVSPVQPTTEAASTQKSLEKPTSPAAVPSAAGKAPAAPAVAPAPAMALAPTTAAPSPSTPMPFVTPNVPPAAGVAPPGMPPASTGAYALYPPVPSWPCFGPQSMGCHGLPPPPSTGSPSTFHVVPGLPPPAMAWPPPAVPPPPPFGPGGPYAPVGWAPPSYWPGVPMPPLVPPLTYGDPGVALQGAATFPAGGCPSTALLHGEPPPAQPPTTPASKVGTAGGPAKPAASRVSDPRRQARLAGDSSIPKTTPAPVQTGRVPPAAPAQHTAAPQAAPTQPLEEPQTVTPTQLPKVPPAAIHCPAEVSPAAGTVEESPGSHPTEEAAGLGKEAVEKALLEPKAAAGQEPPGQKSTSQAVAAPPPPKSGRESSLPTKALAARPWRHQPLLSPVQPSNSSKDIVQAFISEIGERKGAGHWAEHHQPARLQCCWQPWVVGLVPGTLGCESGKAAPAGLQSVSSTVPECCLQWMVWAGCAQTGPSWGCRAGCSCPCYGRHGAAAGFATASPPQHSPHHLGRLMQGEDGAGVHPCSAGRVLADLTCCALSLSQGLKPPTCPACWSSLRSLKVRMQRAVPSSAGLPPCHAGLPRLPILSAMEWELAGARMLLLGCCYPAWVPCPVGVSAPISFHTCEKQLGIPGVAKGVVKSLGRKGDFQHLSARSWVMAL